MAKLCPESVSFVVASPKMALFEEPGVASKGLDHRQRQHGVGLHLLPLAEAALRLLVPLCQDLLKGLARACVGG